MSFCEATETIDGRPACMAPGRSLSWLARGGGDLAFNQRIIPHLSFAVEGFASLFVPTDWLL